MNRLRKKDSACSQAAVSTYGLVNSKRDHPPRAFVGHLHFVGLHVGAVVIGGLPRGGAFSTTENFSFSAKFLLILFDFKRKALHILIKRVISQFKKSCIIILLAPSPRIFFFRILHFPTVFTHLLVLTQIGVVMVRLEDATAKRLFRERLAKKERPGEAVCRI